MVDEIKKVDHPQLQTAVGTHRVHAQIDKDKVTFTECANHLSALVSELPDFQLNRKVSAADTKVRAKHIRGGGSSISLASKCKGIYMPDGSVWTGYYSDCETMSDADKRTVMDTRKKNKATDHSSVPEKAGDSFGGIN